MKFEKTNKQKTLIKVACNTIYPYIYPMVVENQIRRQSPNRPGNFFFQNGTHDTAYRHPQTRPGIGVFWNDPKFFGPPPPLKISSGYSWFLQGLLINVKTLSEQYHTRWHKFQLAGRTTAPLLGILPVIYASDPPIKSTIIQLKKKREKKVTGRLQLPRAQGNIMHLRWKSSTEHMHVPQMSRITFQWRWIWASAISWQSAVLQRSVVTPTTSLADSTGRVNSKYSQFGILFVPIAAMRQASPNTEDFQCRWSQPYSWIV